MTGTDLINYCNNHHTVYCYGAGKYGRYIRAFLQENGIELTAFVVTGDDEHDDVLGVSVKSISNASFLVDDGILIGVGKGSRNQVLDELRHRNISNFFVVSEQIIHEIETELIYKSWYKFCNPVWVLYYHRVNQLESDIWRLSITPELFEEHMRYLSENFNMIGVADINKGITAPSVAVTFDDGYADNYYNALPILEKYSIPATIFVSTGNLDTNEEFWWDKLERIINTPSLPDLIEWQGNEYATNNFECRRKTCYEMHPILKEMSHIEREKELERLADIFGVKLSGYEENRVLTKEELRALAESEYITIGAHTITHSCLKNETELEQKNEITESKRKIEEIIGKSITCFSFPFGGIKDFSNTTLSVLESSGVDMAFTTISGLASKTVDYLTIPRNWISNDMAVCDLEKMLMKMVLLYG